MLNTEKLYAFINTSLFLQGIKDVREVSVELLTLEMKKYLMFKLGYFNLNKKNSYSLEDIIKSYEHLDMESLFIIYESCVGRENSVLDLSMFIHYILSYMSLVQEFEITWKIDDDFENPTFIQSEYDIEKIDSLVTKKDIDCYEVFLSCITKANELKESRSR